MSRRRGLQALGLEATEDEASRAVNKRGLINYQYYFGGPEKFGGERFPKPQDLILIIKAPTIHVSSLEGFFAGCDKGALEPQRQQPSLKPYITPLCRA